MPEFVKFVTESYQSPGGFRKLDYSGPWPKEIDLGEEFDPAQEGQYARGIHVLPIDAEADFSNVIVGEHLIKVSCNPEDVLYAEGKGNVRLRRCTVLGEASEGERDLLRQAACQMPDYAFGFAHLIDKAPRDDTRQAACAEPSCAYYYARYVDKAPRDDTRAAACVAPHAAYAYARSVDKAPRNDTRHAACKDAKWAYQYALYIDEVALEETYRAVMDTMSEDSIRASMYVALLGKPSV